MFRSEKMDAPRSFLYDDYMESDLYGQGSAESFSVERG